MKLIFKSLVKVFMVVILAVSLAGCGSKGFDKSGTISPISREEGSGTRGAFTELFGVLGKDDKGKHVDMTSQDIEITNSTEAVIQSVAGNLNGIGYISMGSLRDDVKALSVDGAEPTPENVENGKYKIARPFNMVKGKKNSPLSEDFERFIMSKQGQEIVKNSKYIPIKEAMNNEYKSSDIQGELSVTGSSSVTPLMQKLAEAYGKLNPKAKVQVQQSDSTTGVNSVIDGACDLGMASRELKDSETQKGAKPVVIARDGIAVIVNKENTIKDIKKESVKAIYTKKATLWKDVM